MANSRRLRRGVVKQLSNLSIDEVSLVDRGANQHALISIAKRAPEAGDYFDEEVSKENFNRGSNLLTLPFTENHNRNLRATYGAHPKLAGALGMSTGMGAGKTTRVAAGHVGGAIAGAAAGGALGRLAGPEGTAVGAGVGAVAGHLAGGAHEGQVVHNHYYGGKRAPEEASKRLDVDDLFSVEKKGSFGQGGNQAKIDTFSGDDPAGVTDDENGEKGDVGPGKKISGVEVTEGETDPPQKSKKKQGASDINPTKLSGLGKSADFWKNVVSKVLEGEEFTTDFDDYDETVGKHFPGGMGAPQNPMQSPFPGAQGAGMAPTMQTPGVQPMGMGQPTPPPGQGMAPAGGMGQALPPDVVQYIQQLEQMLDQLTGGQDNGSQDGSDDSSSSSSDSGSSDDTKKNPFGKSLETSDMDDTTFLTELAKSLDDDSADRETVSKAMEIVTKAEQRAKQAEEIAKAERDLRLEREFVAKAAEFNLPVKSTDLGPVLKRAAENLDTEDFKTIVKCLRAASAAEDFGGNLYGEVGKRGGGDNADILSSVDAAAQELVTKSDSLTPEAATLQVLMDNPAAYDEYLRDHPSRRAFR